MPTKAPKAWALPKFWVSIRFYKKQPVKKIWARILGLAWLKFAVAALILERFRLINLSQLPLFPGLNFCLAFKSDKTLVRYVKLEVMTCSGFQCTRAMIFFFTREALESKNNVGLYN